MIRQAVHEPFERILEVRSKDSLIEPLTVIDEDVSVEDTGEGQPILDSDNGLVMKKNGEFKKFVFDSEANKIKLEE